MLDLVPLRDEIDLVRNSLTDYLPWSPHDFIRKPVSFSASDKELYVESLTREIEEANDLRFIFRTRSLELALLAERLPWDSDFFGYEVARINAIFPIASEYSAVADYGEAIRVFIAKLKERGVRYVFMPVWPEDLATVRGVCVNGFVLIETRAYYHRSLKNYAYPQRFATRLATSADIPILGRAAQMMVNPYDRFHADPFIKKDDANRLMHKWIEASINEGFADVTLVPDAPAPTAFCTVKYHSDKWERWGLKLGQPVFSAVSPEFQGWYMRIISECNYHLAEIGAEYCFLVTQSTNRAVVRSWEKLGFSYGRSEHIFRLVL